MLNVDAFIERLEKIMESHQLTAAAFAEKIGVQRSSVSHILSKRNKPSLDFILKITSTFKELDIHWLLNGKGVFPKNSTTEITSTPLFQNESGDENKKIQRIVVFYTDGTFDEFKK